MIDVSTGRSVELSDVVKNHAVVEASAGTGKTYTIERLVERILLDVPDVNLENILLVTYTEKAAGELRERIRKHLGEAVSGLDGQVRLKFLDALDNFDSASISTIHGFCNRVLNEFAFENARPLDLEQGSNAVMFERLLGRIIRQDWPFAPPAAIAGAMKRQGAVIEMAQRVRRDDVIEPGYSGDISGCSDWRDLISWSVGRLREMVEIEGRASSTVSFDNMITDVRDALAGQGPRSEALLAILRGRYRFALVDEFQDTDPDQWEIFRRVFVDGGGPNRLVVVGDPKQAIYGFRGADIQTYLTARKYLCEGCGGRLYRLDCNYRSLPGLISGFNGLFGSGTWFSQGEGGMQGIEYDPSQAPVNPGAAVSDLIADRSGRAPVVPVSISTGSELAAWQAAKDAGVKPAQLKQFQLNAGAARWRWLSFICREIEFLVRHGGMVVRDETTGGPRNLDYGDICILYRKMPEDRQIMRALRAAGVPYSFYKEKGLYDSAEALNLAVLMKALAAVGTHERRRTARKARLTRFFVAGTDAAGRLSVVDEAGFDRVMAGWRGLCDERRWPELFDSILNLTGLLAREALEPDAERRISNWRQMVFELCSAADAGSLSIEALTSVIQARRAGIGDEVDSDVHRIETERPCVHVMTMHACKGLQFPIVFCYPGMSAGKPTSRGYIRGYRGATRHFIVTDDDGIPPGVVVDDDLSRLFYVAMTRARFKLYFAASVNLPSSRKAPIGLFIKDGCGRLFESTAPGTVWTRLDAFGNLEEGGAQPLVSSNLQEFHDVATAWVVPDLEIPGRINWKTRGQWLDSYSSFRNLGVAVGTVVDGVPEKRADDDVAPGPFAEVTGVAPEPGAAAEPGQILLPPGPDTGTALHEVLEAVSRRTYVRGAGNVDFTDLQRIPSVQDLLSSPLGSIIDRRMAAAGIANRQRLDGGGRVVDSTRHQFGGLIMNALCTPLAPSGDLAFRVCDIPSRETLAEMEFHVDERVFPGIPEWRRGLLHGFIDLIFRRDGRYWFLDWKTTTPHAISGGVAPAGFDPYSPRHLGAEMARNGYDIQAQIYSVAMMQWLSQSFGADAGRMFGGGFFLFARGMTQPGRGVWSMLRSWDGVAVPEYAPAVSELLSRSAAMAALAVEVQR